MSPIAQVLGELANEIGEISARIGRRVNVRALRITDRTGELALAPGGRLVSPNGACRMFRVADGWMALNLAREEDRELVPAWLECGWRDDPWALVNAYAQIQTTEALRERAILLGLPAGVVGEARPTPPATLREQHTGFSRSPRVVDLSALWAGPMCGAVLAAMGAEVTKVESVRRPDPTRTSTPDFHRRLNGRKAALALDLDVASERARLREMVHHADVVITSARPRGLVSIGLDPASLAAQPGLVWVAVTGYGLAAPERVAFGDDAAAAGGLVGRSRSGEPHFLGDALSDPVTGMAAALGALRALEGGGGAVIDAGMAPTAAWAATRCTAPVA